MRPFELVEVAYPGFEDRPRVGSLPTFLDAIASQLNRSDSIGSRNRLLYATGIGGLLALGLRARGDALDLPLLFQAPVLWGLEHRLMPRLMRLRLARSLLGWIFANHWFQARFVRKHFIQSPSTEMRRSFFDGYARCTALPDFFAWLTPGFLRSLEHDLAARPGALEQITVWWGGRDSVVSLQELAWTEQALGVKWPVRIMPHWGHYPMLDVPQEWVGALGELQSSTGDH